MWIIKQDLCVLCILFRCVLASLYEALSVDHSVRTSVRPSVVRSVHSSETCKSRSRWLGMIGNHWITTWGSLETSYHSHLRNHLSHLRKKSNGSLFVPTGTCQIDFSIEGIQLALVVTNHHHYYHQTTTTTTTTTSSLLLTTSSATTISSSSLSLSQQQQQQQQQQRLQLCCQQLCRRCEHRCR